jgi:GT2 family glycosyltransferase
VPADVTVIIVNWNAAAVLGACLDSIDRQAYDGRVGTLVVDNGSTDGSLALLAGREPRVTVLALGDNRGFARANNAGLRRVTTPLVVFLNPDTELLGPHALARLLRVLDDPSVGLAGPRLVNPDGTTQRSCGPIPTLPSLLLHTFGLHRLLPDALRRRWAPSTWSHDRSTDTGWVTGACMAVRRADVTALGGFSERTFMYGEDLELCARVRRRRLRVRYERDAEVLHLADHSSAQRWTAPATAALVAAGDVAFLEQRYGPVRLALALRLLRLAYAGRAAVLRRLGRDERASIYAAMARAVRSGGAR